MQEQAQQIARAVVGRLEAAWNAADGAAFGEAFTEEADFVAVRGDFHRGRQAIAEGHQAIFDSVFKASKLDYVLLGARHLADEVILAHAQGDLSAPTGPLAGEHSVTTTLVLVLDDGEWRITAFQNTLVAPIT